MREPSNGTRTQIILEMLRLAQPNGMTSKRIQQRFPGVRSKFINAALYRMWDGGLVRNAEVFGAKTWFAERIEQRRAA